jgi:hypothetical protein
MLARVSAGRARLPLGPVSLNQTAKTSISPVIFEEGGASKYTSRS